jgi:hypothetical protein
MAEVAAVADRRRRSADAGTGCGVRPGIRWRACSGHPRCRAPATYVRGPGRCERPGGRRRSSSEPGCAMSAQGVGSSRADRRWGGKKIFCCVTTRGRNGRVLHGFGRDFGSLAALFLGLGVAGLDHVVLAASSLAARRLPAADFPLALRVLAVALVPAPRLVLASAAFAQADPWARSPPSGQTAVLLRTVRGAHGSGHSRGNSSGRMWVAFSSSAINTRTRRRHASLPSWREPDGERRSRSPRWEPGVRALPVQRSSSRERGRRAKRIPAPRWELDEGVAVEVLVFARTRRESEMDSSAALGTRRRRCR